MRRTSMTTLTSKLEDVELSLELGCYRAAEYQQDVAASSGRARANQNHWGTTLSVGRSNIASNMKRTWLTSRSNEDIRRRAAVELKELVVITARGTTGNVRP